MTLTPQQRTDAATLLIDHARKDPAVFNRLVYRDSTNGKPWEMQWFQREWEDAIESNDWPIDPDGQPIVRLVILAPAGHAKTESIARSWLTRRIAKNPNLKAVILCNEQGAGNERLEAVSGDIKTNKRLQAVYPGLRPAAGKKWREDRIFCERDIDSKDPTLQAVGVHGAVIGARLNIGVVDDPCDFESTFTSHQRAKTLKWFNVTFTTRFDGRGIIVVIMTSWHEDDLGHALVREHGYKLMHYEACNEKFENVLWPEKFPEDLLRKMHATDPGPIEFSRTYRNKIMDDSFRRIQMAWIQKCLDRGLGIPAGVVPEGATATYTGVDPAGGRSKTRGDMSALFTFSTMPNGDRHAIEAEEDRITSPELRGKIETKWNLWHPLFCVEDNGVQVWLKQEVIHQSAIQIVGRDTGGEKWNPSTGVESIGIEMYNGKWIIPSVMGPQGKAVAATTGLQAWVDQMANFEHGAHTGDLLMANYIGRCVAREEESRQRKRISGIRIGKGVSRESPWRSGR